MNYTELKAQIIDICENNFEEVSLAMFTRQAEQKIYNTVQLANLRKNVTGILTTGNKYLSCPDDFLSPYSLAVYPYNTTTATGTSGQSTIVVASASGITVGQAVSGVGIATGALVRAISGTTITLNIVNSGTVSGAIVFQGDYLYLLNKDVNFIREAYPNTSATSQPKHYAIFGPTSTDVRELTFIVGPTPNYNYRAELHYFYYPPSIVDAGTSWLGDNFDSALLNGALIEALRFMKGEAADTAVYDKLYAQAIGLLKNFGDGKQRMDAYRDGQYRMPVT
jgi:hypothetical protein